MHFVGAIEDVAAHRVEDHVGAAGPPVFDFHHGDEILRLVVHHHVGRRARGNGLDLLRAAGRRDGRTRPPPSRAGSPRFPTPPAPAWTSTVSPARRAARAVAARSGPVWYVIVIAAASSKGIAGGEFAYVVAPGATACVGVAAVGDRGRDARAREEGGDRGSPGRRRRPSKPGTNGGVGFTWYVPAT